MSIASEITRIKSNIQAAYAALTNKNITLPEEQNLENLVGCVQSLPPYMGKIVTRQGVYQTDDSRGNFTFTLPSNIKTIAGGAMRSYFEFNNNVVHADFSSLKTIYGSGCEMLFAFGNGLESIDFSNLEYVSNDGLSQAFRNQPKLTSVVFPKLSSVSYSSLKSAFAYCTSLTEISFPAVTSFHQPYDSLRCFNYMLQGVNGCTVHFTTALEPLMGDHSDVTSGFAGINTTVLFDLPVPE